MVISIAFICLCLLRLSLDCPSPISKLYKRVHPRVTYHRIFPTFDTIISVKLFLCSLLVVNIFLYFIQSSVRSVRYFSYNTYLSPSKKFLKPYLELPIHSVYLIFILTISENSESLLMFFLHEKQSIKFPSWFLVKPIRGLVFFSAPLVLYHQLILLPAVLPDHSIILVIMKIFSLI